MLSVLKKMLTLSFGKNYLLKLYYWKKSQGKKGGNLNFGY